MKLEFNKAYDNKKPLWAVYVPGYENPFLFARKVNQHTKRGNTKKQIEQKLSS